MKTITNKKCIFFVTRNVIQKRKIDVQNWKPIFVRELSLKNGKFSKLSDRQLPNDKSLIYFIQSSCFKSVQQGTPLCQKLCDLIIGKNYFNFRRNFSASKAVGQLFGRRTQDKERLKNYIFFGVILVLALGVTYLNLTIEKHQDYIYIETEEPTEKK